VEKVGGLDIYNEMTGNNKPTTLGKCLVSQ
jgi:hypothetical protein